MRTFYIIFGVCICFGIAADSGKHTGQTWASSVARDTTLGLGTTRRRQALQNADKLAAYASKELLLRQLVDECSKGLDTVLQLGRNDEPQVHLDLPIQGPCPAIDIALRAKERGVGMCTDAVLYVIYAGARIIPLLPPAQMRHYNRKCGNLTARMFLETMYKDWLLPGGSALHLMQVNSEHLFLEHAHLHPYMNIFLCKTRFCQLLMKQYRDDKNFSSKVWYVGHTSSDVLVENWHAELSDTDFEALPGTAFHQQAAGRHLHAVADVDVSAGNSKQSTEHIPGIGSRSKRRSLSDFDDGSSNQETTAGRQTGSGLHSGSGFRFAANYSQFLHVKGKSGLKHTEKILECWAGRPDLPLLTVIGQHSLDEPHVRTVLKSNNVLLLPPPTPPHHKPTQQKQLLQRQLGHAVSSQQQAFGEMAASLSSAIKQQLLISQKQQEQQHTVDSDSSIGFEKPSTGSFAAMDPVSIAGDIGLRSLQAADLPHLHSLLSLKPGSLLTFAEIRFLQTSIGLHLCPSEREGFGHYLNEARAAGALVVTTDHPPMNELIDSQSGHLIKPVRSESYADIMALAPYGKINAFLEAKDICRAVDKVLELSVAERAAKGTHARRQYVLGKNHFMRKMQRLVKMLDIHASRNVGQSRSRESEKF